ncbi:MAG TPA: hypothetical protein VGA38_10685 [Candidatus Limnocylindria bacterium]
MRVLLLMLLLVGDAGIPEPGPQAQPRPQYVIVSFDGAGDAEHLDHWTAVGDRVGARFTFFLSGVYLLDGDRANLYQPPRHRAGVSDIGFAIAPPGTDVRRNIADLVRSLNAASVDGHEIASHFNGHFCGRGPGAVGGWGPADWSREIDAFDDLVGQVAEHNDLPGMRTAFGRIAGARTPCFEGIAAFERQAIAAHGYRYDASEPGGGAPYRADGIWEIPIPLMEVAGAGYRTLATDYNLYLNQSRAEDVSPDEASAFRAQAYESYRALFWSRYDGAREPVIIAHHFEDWNDGAYSLALEGLLAEVCHLRDVRCATYRDLVDALDAGSRP